MNNTINGRTPEEIKKGLECYGCDECPYNRKSNNGEARCEEVEADALAYIQQLERERDAAVERCVNADDVSAGYYQEIQQLESTQPKWISVEERLPEDDLPENSDAKAIKVFVAIKGKNGTTVRTQTRHRRTLFDTRGEPFFDWEWRYSSGKVTHWMPLPEPPKEEMKYEIR